MRENGNMKFLWNEFMRWHCERYNRNRAKGLVTFDTLEFPIRWDRSTPLLQHLFYVYKYYVEELREFAKSNVSINEVESICNTILRSYYSALHWRTEDAIKIVTEDANINEIMENCKVTIPANLDLYRLRANMANLLVKNDFMHIPFDKIYLCSSARFSMYGEPCLYLGYSKDVCYKELGVESGGSMGHFKTKEELTVVDLTLDKLNNKNVNIFLMWPILAACYVTADNRDANFKEEYIYPQVMMHYIKSKIDCKGVRYYTCRYPELDITSDAYMNIALFARTNENSDNNEIDISKDFPSLFSSPYDMVLSGKLDFIV